MADLFCCRYVKPPIFTLCVGNAWGEAATSGCWVEGKSVCSTFINYHDKAGVFFTMVFVAAISSFNILLLDISKISHSFFLFPTNCSQLEDFKVKQQMSTSRERSDKCENRIGKINNGFGVFAWVDIGHFAYINTTSIIQHLLTTRNYSCSWVGLVIIFLTSLWQLGTLFLQLYLQQREM